MKALWQKEESIRRSKIDNARLKEEKQKKDDYKALLGMGRYWNLIQCNLSTNRNTNPDPETWKQKCDE